MKWEIQVRAYLTGAADHVRVIRRTRNSAGVYADPAPPSDPDECKAWDKSERVAMSVIMVTASELHLELVHKMGEEPAWKVWKAIKAQHQQHDMSLWHEAWMHLFSVWKKPTKTYVDFYR